MRVGILGSGLMGGKLGTLLRGPARRRMERPSLVYTEAFALLVAQLAYEGTGGPQLAYRFERFGK